MLKQFKTGCKVTRSLWYLSNYKETERKKEKDYCLYSLKFETNVDIQERDQPHFCGERQFRTLWRRGRLRARDIGNVQIGHSSREYRACKALTILDYECCIFCIK